MQKLKDLMILELSLVLIWSYNLKFGEYIVEFVLFIGKYNRKLSSVIVV